MPGIDGIDLCRRIWAATENPYSFVILLTGKDDKKDLPEAMDSTS